jgi:hypothetical protein
MKTKLTYFAAGAASSLLLAFAYILVDLTWFQPPPVSDTTMNCVKTPKTK